MGGGNQWIPNMPSLPQSKPSTGGPTGTPSGLAPINSAFTYNGPAAGSVTKTPNSTPTTPGTSDVGGGIRAGSTLDPSFTNNWYNWLSSQMGKGATPYGGELSSPINQLLQSLFSGFMGGQSNVPGMSTLADIAKNGIDVVPTWQTMVDAMGRQKSEGAANLKEQFSVAGGLAGSPFGSAMTDYNTQSNKDMDSILAQLQFQGTGLQMQAAQDMTSGASTVGQLIQSLNQSSDDRLYNEWMRTQPEYSPLLQYFSQGAFTFPPFMGNQQGTGLLGSLMQNSGGIANLLKSLGKLFSGGGGGAGSGSAGGASGSGNYSGGAIEGMEV